ncbi:hypothetical protein SteCoe_14972 [Stentor coeruleus]|uniref:Rab-GAP TBC domain-containing protein n=1 Tax=Stentor coeruleus TaxID=5963 RepID=A0A1R2C4Q0_9CILI|nr:hypothetical protein SteCoe_14972 [Stentor coeruleus]
MSEELIPPDFLLHAEAFESYFINRENYSNIRQLALDGKLGQIHNRFTCWRVFLGILPEAFSIDLWVERVEELRRSYFDLVKSHRDLKSNNLDPLIFNPLSSSTENPWNNFHVDNELKTKIRNDVERTFQERPLFQVPKIQELMVNILFTWAKENPDISYKQGMNELLGVLIFVAYAEQAPENMSISYKNQEYINILNNPESLEADVYWCFVRLMDLGIAELFNPVVMHRQGKKKPDLFTWDAEKSHNDLVNQDKSTAEGVSSVLKKCHKIHHRILQTVDNELYLYLEKQKIEPQMYLQRYVRCILSREFNLADTLIIWDAIFAHLSPNSDFKAESNVNLCKELSLLDYICVAMIVFVRVFILQSDNSGILRRLLKFPPVEDVHILIDMGLGYKQSMQDRSSKNLKTPVVSNQILNPQPISTPHPIVNIPETPISTPIQIPCRPAPTLPTSSSNLLINPLISKTPSKNIEKPSEIKFIQDKTIKRTVENNLDKGKGVMINPLLSKPIEKNKTTEIIVLNQTNNEKKIKNTSPKSSSPVGLKKEEEKKEEVKINVVRNENSLVEKCNQALLLLLEQCDEQAYHDEKMNKALQVLYALKDEASKEMAKKKLII